MASLQLVDARPFELVADRMTLGWDPVNDVVLRGDPKISRSHAELDYREGRWTLLDMGSRNGTTVNGRRITRHPLRDGDRIQFGNTLLTYSSGHDENETEVAGSTGPAALGLSGREVQKLALEAQGLTDRAIGEELSISVSTVRSHLDRIREKTGLRRRKELTRIALQSLP